MQNERGHNKFKSNLSVNAAKFALCAMLAFSFTSQTVFADDDERVSTLQTSPTTATDGLSLNLSAVNANLPSLGAGLNEDMSIDLIGASSAVIDLDMGELSCFGLENVCMTQNETIVGMELSKKIKEANGRGLDVEVIPSAKMQFNDGAKSAGLGAMVRIGDDLREGDVASNTWYVFAGADAEARDYSAENTSGLYQGEFGLQNRLIIGDAQAGIGYRIGDADVSLGYFRREISSYNDAPGASGFSASEDAAALSFTLRK